MAIERVTFGETGEVTLYGVRQVIIRPETSTDVKDVAFLYRINDGPIMTTVTTYHGGYGEGSINLRFGLPTKIWAAGISQIGVLNWGVYFSREGRESEVFRIPFPVFSSSPTPPPSSVLSAGDIVYALSTVSSGGYTANSIYFRRSGIDTLLCSFPSGVAIKDFTFDRVNSVIYAVSDAGAVYSASLIGTAPITLQARFTDANIRRIIWSPSLNRIAALNYGGAGATSYISTYLPGSGAGSRVDLAGPVDILNVKFSADESNSYFYCVTGETGGGGVGIRYVAYAGGAGTGRVGGIAGELFTAVKASSGNARFYYNNNNILRYNDSTSPPTFTGPVTLGALSIVNVLSGSYYSTDDDLYLARTTGVWIIDAAAGTEVGTIGTFNCLHAEVY